MNKKIIEENSAKLVAVHVVYQNGIAGWHYYKKDLFGKGITACLSKTPVFVKLEHANDFADTVKQMDEAFPGMFERPVITLYQLVPFTPTT